MSLDLKQTYLLLMPDGEVQQIQAEGFWLEDADASARVVDGWLVSEHRFDRDWDIWEMHPDGDELVRLVEGAVDVLMEYPDGVRMVPLRGQDSVLVPRGVWHTARMSVPSCTLHVSRGTGTRHRPA